MALLERDGRRVRLTPAAAGSSSAPTACSPSSMPPRPSSRPSTERPRQLVIGAFPSAAARLVVPAVHELKARHPELAARSASTSPRTGSAAALRRAGRAGLRELRRRLARSGRRAGAPRLLTEPLLLVGRTAAQGPVDLATLAAAPWIGGAGSSSRARGNRLRSRGLQAPVRPQRRRGHGLPRACRRRARRRAGARARLLGRGVRYARVARAAAPPHLRARAPRRGRRPAVAAVLEALRDAASAATAG